MKNELITVELEIETRVKRKSEAVLAQMGMSMSTAVNLFLYKLALEEKLPFEPPLAPASLCMDLMSKEELIEELEAGLKDAMEGKCRPIEEFYAEFAREHGFTT